MTSKAALIAGGLVAASALAVGGYLIERKLRCSGYEEDYLNSIASVKSAAAMRSIGGDSIEAAADRIEATEFDAIEKTLGRLYAECGERAAETASRKGTGLLLEGTF